MIVYIYAQFVAVGSQGTRSQRVTRESTEIRQIVSERRTDIRLRNQRHHQPPTRWLRSCSPPLYSLSIHRVQFNSHNNNNDNNNNMGFFFFSNKQATLAKLQEAERQLLDWVGNFGTRPDGFSLKVLDTEIDGSSIPLRHCQGKNPKYTIHGIHVESTPAQQQQQDDATTTTMTKTTTPLVLVHGYMNGAAYFYRNLQGLSHRFSNIYALDWLGWGQSSRPSFRLTNDSRTGAEDFFCESLEAWRVRCGIDKMVLAGHSMGGYLSVAYCERYPQHVERLILISPVGVPEETDQIVSARRNSRRQSNRIVQQWFFGTLFRWGTTPCDALRVLPHSTARGYFTAWANHHLKDNELLLPEERETVANYLYFNCVLPGSGEYALQRILNMYAYAKEPTVRRIPQLRVPHVSFLYGVDDWMDSSGGLAVQQICQEQQQQHESPKVSVYQVKDAGHMLLMENWAEFNAAMILASGGTPPSDQPMPKTLQPQQQ